MKSNSNTLWLLIAAQVVVFGYFGITKFTEPLNWLGFLPSWIDGLLGMPKETWLSIIGAIEILLAMLILIPVDLMRKIGAGLIVLHLIGVILQVGWNDVGVRDAGLLLSAIALFFLLPSLKNRG